VRNDFGASRCNFSREAHGNLHDLACGIVNSCESVRAGSLVVRAERRLVAPCAAVFFGA